MPDPTVPAKDLIEPVVVTPISPADPSAAAGASAPDKPSAAPGNGAGSQPFDGGPGGAVRVLTPEPAAPSTGSADELKKQNTKLAEELAGFKDALALLASRPDWPQLERFLVSGGRDGAPSGAPANGSPVVAEFEAALSDVATDEGKQPMKRLLDAHAKLVRAEVLQEIQPFLARTAKSETDSEEAAGMREAGVSPEFLGTEEYKAHVLAFNEAEPWIRDLRKRHPRAAAKVVAKAFAEQRRQGQRRTEVQDARDATLETRGSGGGPAATAVAGEMVLPKRASMQDILKGYKAGATRFRFQ